MNGSYKPLSPLINRLQKIILQAEVEPNFFAIGTYGLYENPISDLMALFMGRNPHVPPYLTRALLSLLEFPETDSVDLSELSVEREVMTDEGFKLDIVILHDEFVIGIENKLFSPVDNPLVEYTKKLRNYCHPNGGRTRNLYKCILKPKSNLSKTKGNCDWQIFTYQDLVEKAKQTLGIDIINIPVTKWQHFYQEFLGHLSTIGEINMENELNQDDFEFTQKHYCTLLKVEPLLKRYADTIHNHAKKYLAKTLNLNESEIEQEKRNWGNNYKALYLIPQSWKDRASIVIVYYPDENGKLQFYINGYFYGDVTQLENIKRQAEQEINDNKFINMVNLNDHAIAYENKKKSLYLSFWGLSRDKDGALNAIPDMAKWMSKFLE